jgi:hypothetical protein
MTLTEAAERLPEALIAYVAAEDGNDLERADEAYNAMIQAGGELRRALEAVG